MSLKERMSGGIFLLDGAMGTQLIARGIEVGKCNDYLNVESPDVVSDIHHSYLRRAVTRFLPIHSGPINMLWDGIGWKRRRLK